MKRHLLCVLLLTALFSAAQKREEFFDHRFQPSQTSPYYFVVTEKKDSGWYRHAYYISQRSMAMKGWYLDEAGKIEHGLFTWYHPTRFIKSVGHYANGKKEGVWLGYDEKGILTDSSIYAAGRRTGVSLHWYSNGYLRDSLNYDEQGNGVQVSWYDDGLVASAGRLIKETRKHGRWKHYDKKGGVIATEDYVEGKKIASACYDEAGMALDSADCVETAAQPAGGITGWRRFLEQSMGELLADKARSRQWGAGKFVVVIRFAVEKDGSLSEFEAQTQYGRGVEDEVIRMLQRAPRWTPGRQRGRPVKSYHTQPVTFMIQDL